MFKLSFPEEIFIIQTTKVLKSLSEYGILFLTLNVVVKDKKDALGHLY